MIHLLHSLPSAARSEVRSSEGIVAAEAMTQRSAERWNTGKRGAALRRAERSGQDYAERLLITFCPEGLLNRRIVGASMSRPPRLADAFRRGAWRWVESQPVVF